MSILNRKPVKYSTSDLIWDPSPAPTDGTVGDLNALKVDPSHLNFAQDVIISKDGTLRSRGGFNTIASLTKVPLSLLQLKSATSLITWGFNGTNFDTKLQVSTTNALTAFGAATAIGESGSMSDNNLIDTSTADFNWEQLKLNDKDAAILTGSIPYGAGSDVQQSTEIWSGSSLTNSTNSGTFATTIGTTSVIGTTTAWTSALNDAYLMDNATGYYFGQVKNVSSATALTLYEPAYASAAGLTPNFKAVRMLRMNVYKGYLTTTTTSPTVIGSGTKFQSSGPSKQSGVNYLAAWNLFRLSDGAFIGTVSTIQNDTTLTLTGNAAINMNNQEYVARASNNGSFMNNFIPLNYITAQTCEYYADRYWYGGLYLNDYSLNAIAVPKSNTMSVSVKAQNSLTFTHKNQPELFDVSSSTGDILTVPSIGSLGEDIRCLKAMTGGMLVLRGKDAFFLTGFSPETFRLIKVVDDGCLGAHYVKKYNGGVVFCGTKSIWFFDGRTVVDLLQGKVKDFYAKNVTTNSGVAPGAGMAYAFDHMIVSWRSGATFPTWPYKNTTDSLVSVSLVINMLNGAISFFTNCYLRGSTDYTLSASTIVTPTLFAGNGSAAGYFFDARLVFNESAVAGNNVDGQNWVNLIGGFNTNSTVIGPMPQFETVKYSLKDGSRLKFFKMFLMNYKSDQSLTASVSGVISGEAWPNTTVGTIVGSVFPVNATSLLKRVKFLVRAPSISVRVYVTNAPTAGQSQRFKMYWYTIGGKFMRIGRQQ